LPGFPNAFRLNAVPLGASATRLSSPSSSTPFRLMTWNVENLLRVGDQGGPPPRPNSTPNCARWPRSSKQQPDVLALQEIGHPDVLAALQHQLTHKLPHHQLSTHPTSAASAWRCSAAYR
jgi:hypothetical protein